MHTAIFSVLLLFLVCVRASPVPLPLPLPQAVTANIAPPSQTPLPGCIRSYPGVVFGIAIMNVSSVYPSPSPGTSTQINRRQQQEDADSTSSSSPVFTVAPVSQINDGQVQGGMHTVTMTPVSQIGDGQVQNPGSGSSPGPVVITMMPALAPATVTATANLASARVGAATGAATGAGTDVLSSGTGTGFVFPTKPPTMIEQACGISSRTSGGAMPLMPTYTAPIVPSTPFPPANISTSASTIISLTAPLSSTPATETATATETETEPEPPRFSLVSCLTNSTLRLTLTDDGILRDSRNRTGYIASNYQFQFDGPPQAGALYTSGWSVCPLSPPSTSSSSGSYDDSVDGGEYTLALGGSTMFWQCLSGDFYNLYTEDWAAQCSPVQLRVVGFVDC